MKKLFKILLALIVIVIATVVVITLVVDPNDYKAEIQAQAKQALNRDLVIEGDLSWTLFPTLGVTTGKVRIENPQGFNRKNLLSVDAVSAGIKLFPLLSANVELGQLSLDGFRLHLVTRRDGTSNLADIGSKKQQSDAPQGQEGDGPTLGSISLAGLMITNAEIETQDLVNKTSTSIALKEMSLTEFSLGETSALKVIIALSTDGLNGEFVLNSDIKVSTDLQTIALNNLELESLLSGTSLPNGDLTLSMGSNITVTTTPLQLAVNDLAIKANDISLSGNASVAIADKTKVRYELAGNVWNVDQFMTSSEETPKAEEQAPEVEPNLTFLNGLDVDGQLVIEGMKVSGMTLGKTTIRTVVENGVAKLAPLTAQLYEGSITLNAEVVGGNGQNSYAIEKQITGIAVQPLLKDLADTDLLAGTTNFSFKATGRGLALSKIKKGLQGSGQFEVLDGALYGINIPQKIRSAKAMFGSSDAETANDEKKTDFTALTGQFVIAQGVVNNTALEMAAPFVRLDGKGFANIIDSTLDYHLKATLVGTSKGQGGASGDDLMGVAIPMKIEGSFSDPKYSLDTSGALKSKVDEQKEQAKDKLKRKLSDKLGSFFN